MTADPRSILVVDVGTSAVRAVVVRADGSVAVEHRRELPPTTPQPGLVEFDGVAMATAVLDVAHAALADAGPVAAVGIADQRASTLVWDRGTGEVVGPGLSWQDLRTVGRCLELQGSGVRVAPNATATKAAWLLESAGRPAAELCVGTVDTWVAWTLSQGRLHVTDASNASVSGLAVPTVDAWDQTLLAAVGVPEDCLPRIVDSAGVVGEASALPGAPPIAGLVGDQQASLLGQACLRPGTAKITFGTGGMLDVNVGERVPAAPAHGTVPMVGWRRDGRTTWCVEGIILSAGSAVEWLRSDLGVVAEAADTERAAASVPDSGGVVFVPALQGLGTPHWDHGARGALLGLTRGSTRAHIVRAVLEGVAQRGADLVDAAEADTGVTIDAVRVDGGMSENGVFVQALADACGRAVEISPHREATAMGAAYLAGIAVDTWRDEDEVASLWRPRQVVEPLAAVDRARWAEAVQRALGWIPELSGITF